MPEPHVGAQFAPVSGRAESPACTRLEEREEPLRPRKGGSDVLTADTSQECPVATLKKDQTAKEGPSCQEQKLFSSEKF